jgi:hypothetical protein
MSCRQPPKLDERDVSEIFDLCERMQQRRDDPQYYPGCDCRHWDPAGTHPCPHVVAAYLAQFEVR